MTRKIFGTDGVRGLANQYPMEPETALALGRAIAHVFKGRGGRHHRIVIGKDTRLSGYMIENALSSGICSMGGEAIFLGPLPTPGIAFITPSMRADAGVVISASHNPYHDNGIKFFDHEGYKLPDEIEAQMEKLLNGDVLKQGPTHEGIGRAYRVDDAVGRYIEHLKSSFPRDLTLDGYKIVVDCANGAAYRVAPVVFEELGAEVISLGVHPNGRNINDQCGALYPDNLRNSVVKHKAHLGIALDGDADRAVLVDEKGEIVHGDALLALFAKNLFERKVLAKNSLVVTVMSNLGLEIGMQGLGLQVVRVQVGDRYVIEAMRRDGFNFGGEQSGHIIFHDHSKTGDGILAGLQALAVMAKQGRKISELAHCIEVLPQVLRNVRVLSKKDLGSLTGLQTLKNKIEKHMGKKGRILLRYSGTEAVLRIMIEGEDLKKIKNYAEDLELAATKELGKV